MMIKTGKNTPILIAVAALVALAKIFIFNPPDSAVFLDYISNIVGTEMGVSGYVIGFLIDFLFPVLGAVLELVAFYMSSILTASGIPVTPTSLLDYYLNYPDEEIWLFFLSNIKALLACEIAIIEYIVIIYFMEQYHERLHKEESVFCICVDMTCVEYILMYILSIVSFVGDSGIALLPDFFEVVLIILAGIMLIIAVPLYLAYAAYIWVDCLITVGPLAVCLYWMKICGWFSMAGGAIEVQSVFSNSDVRFGLCIIISLVVVLLSQLLWRTISDLVHYVAVLIALEFYEIILNILF